MKLISCKYIMTEYDKFWAYAHDVQIGNRIITAWRPSQEFGSIIKFAVNGNELDTRVLISPFDVCVFGKNGTYLTVDVHKFPSLKTTEGLYSLVNWLSAEGYV